jgi:MFS family permease
VATAFAWAYTENWFLFLRFLLGVAEAGFFPGIIYYLSFWFTARRRSGVMGLFYFGAPLSFIFGSPLSGLLLEMDGFLGVWGWQWMFALWHLTDRPETADWLPAAEKQALLEEFQAEAAGKPQRHVSPLKVLGNAKVLYLAAIYFMIQVSVYGVTFYLPTQVGSLMGQKVGFWVGVVSAIPWVCALIANATIPKFSDRSGKRGILAAFLMLCAGVGVLASATGSPVLGVAALSLASAGYFSCQPIFWTMPTRFLSGVAAASAIGLINAVGNLGGMLAPNLRVWAEKAYANPYAGLYALGTASLVGCILFLGSIVLGMGRNTAPERAEAGAGPLPTDKHPVEAKLS